MEEPTVTQPRQQSGIAPKMEPAKPPPPPKEDARATAAVVKAAVDAATAPLLKQIEELRARIAELETRAVPPPAPTPRILTTAPPQAAPAPFAAAIASPASLAPPVPVSIAPAPVMSLPPILPIPTGVIDIDVPFDGRKRQRRVVLATVFFLFVVMAGLFAALGYSYMR
jgi:anti-sigma factor RsiW